jgi:hypothetical protein
MSCEATQEAFSLYVDDRLSLPARAACDEHLRECPVCREQLAQMRSLTRGLAALPRPVPPPDLAVYITNALRTEAGALKRQPQIPLATQMFAWLRPRLMPYTVGAFASCIFFLLMFAGLRSSLMAFRNLDNAFRGSDQSNVRVVLIQSADDGYDIYQPVTPEGFAAKRALYAGESPSLNPKGALAALALSSARGGSTDDEMIVVTDVFSNGRASLADIVQPPRNRRMLDQFQQALRENPSFVPASYDRRPQTMRVVFVIQRVDVPENNF